MGCGSEIVEEIPLEVLERELFLTARECKRARALPSSARAEFAFRLWGLKEAFFTALLDEWETASEFLEPQGPQDALEAAGPEVGWFSVEIPLSAPNVGFVAVQGRPRPVSLWKWEPR